MLSQTDTRVVLPIGPIFIDSRKIDRIEISQSALDDWCAGTYIHTYTPLILFA